MRDINQIIDDTFLADHHQIVLDLVDEVQDLKQLRFKHKAKKIKKVISLTFSLIYKLACIEEIINPLFVTDISTLKDLNTVLELHMGYLDSLLIKA